MHLLVCDDDEATGTLLRSVYVSAGWAVDAVTSGRECIEMVAKSAPDVLVLDQVMPGLSGIDTARLLRQGGFDRPIVLFSGYLAPEMSEAIRELGLMAVSKVDFPAVLRIVDALGAYPHPGAPIGLPT